MSSPSSRANTQRRTWSGLGDIHRLPSEYEIVTHDTNYTTRKGRDAALEQNPSSVANLWFLTYRDRSALQVDDWSGFRDPDQLTYRSYVTAQDQRETVVAGIFEDYSDAHQERGLAQSWLRTLAALFTPVRFLVHGMQMCAAYLGYMAPSSYITNCAAFATADLLRRGSVVAYRTRQLQRLFPSSVSVRASAITGSEIWPGKARAKRSSSRCAPNDWAEAFTALNLVLRPRLDDVWLRQLGELATLHGDEQT